MCECKTWPGYGPEVFGKHHHANCPKYATEKFPYLFYFEEGCEAFVPAPDLVSDIVETDALLWHGDTEAITFKRIDLTDHEFTNLPDVD